MRFGIRCVWILKQRFVKETRAETVSFVWAGEDGGANEGMPVSDADDEGRSARGRIRNPFPSNPIPAVERQPMFNGWNSTCCFFLEDQDL